MRRDDEGTTGDILVPSLIGNDWYITVGKSLVRLVTVTVDADLGPVLWGVTTDSLGNLIPYMLDRHPLVELADALATWDEEAQNEARHKMRQDSPDLCAIDNWDHAIDVARERL